ncbi:MAG: hypothetical protein FJ012_03595 [Chloroflexi bacterium]|nr:hypothetical protein [Chloroflexota bacterium]
MKRIKPEYIGWWRITEMSQWDQEFIDLVAPGHLTVKSNGLGEFAFGAIEADVDCRVEKVGGTERLAFSFEGWDEGDDVSGRGWAEVTGDAMQGWFSFHLGDESTFKAVRQKAR